MKRKRLTLLSDGTADQALLPITQWLLQRHTAMPFEQNWADLGLLRKPPKKLADRVTAALELYPCDILAIHRDAERESPAKRLEEISEAVTGRTLAIVAIVPVRMTEAWLLFDTAAIRRASGCPNGTIDLNLPALKRSELLPDPKEILHEAMRTASNLSGRRRKHFRPNIRRVVELIDDFSPLDILPSFRAAEDSLRMALASLGLLRNAS